MLVASTNCLSSFELIDPENCSWGGLAAPCLSSPASCELTQLKLLPPSWACVPHCLEARHDVINDSTHEKITKTNTQITNLEHGFHSALRHYVLIKNHHVQILSKLRWCNVSLNKYWDAMFSWGRYRPHNHFTKRSSSFKAMCMLQEWTYLYSVRSALPGTQKIIQLA